MDAKPRSRARILRNLFTIVVLAACAIGWIVTALRPEGEWPTFAAPPAVDLEPLEAPAGEQELSGVVVRPGGDPAADVLVEVLAGGFPRWTWTAADGSFRLSDLPEGEHEAVLLAEGHPPTTRAFELSAGQPEPARWVLDEPLREPEPLPPMVRGALTGRLAPSVGSGVAGCEVTLSPVPDGPVSGAVPRRVVADAAGEFAVPDLVHAAYELRVLPPWAEGGSWPVLARAELEHAGGRRLPPVTLEGGRIALRAIDVSGRPVAGALVLVHPEDAPRRVWPPATSSSTGSASVGDLPAGRYVVELHAGAHSARRVVELGPGELASVDFEPLELSPP